ncbi:excinuclease ABC subunit A [Bacillus halotolerans]|uniref:ATP-binding cassette domain-containing protein n=1 Tax=Bacillus halotolerans TaxID=260554 RepID=UPI000D01385F|nr:excinuclease ABC subunit UvrA [Bacillus halotolerans]PRP50341.1 excinuclease ABC subunit A [Bacillus halotolerans]PRP58747.1 excinuclease ABC subunit A [Bacillus halotolerans]PRP62613.1 excinuclease ABC subunit A [Bacillus halotolerans]
MDYIDIKGASLHNLKEIDITIPKNKLVMATGVSGSGKSSLMFDLIFEEGRKSYLESIGVFSGLISDNHYEDLMGISPAVAIQQSVIRQKNPRSTIASKTGILTLLCSLFANYGKLDTEPYDGGERLEPFEKGIFSYNNPSGMCKDCSGLGKRYEVFMEEIISDNNTTLTEVLNKLEVSSGIINVFKRQFKDYIDKPFLNLPQEIQEELINGHYVANNAENRSYCIKRILESKRKKGEEIEKYYSQKVCENCNGQRINQYSRKIKINGKTIGDLCKMSLIELQKSLLELKDNNESNISAITSKILQKINVLIEFRLGYLSLYRDVTTLSGGEIQRLFMSGHLQSRLNSIIYVLDEPTVGLHSSEKEPILEAIESLKELGNTVLIVDHDKKLIERADYIVDIGPKAGVEGGRVVYSGDYNGLLNDKTSLTGAYLSGNKKVYERAIKPIKDDSSTEYLTFKDINKNNLKRLSLNIPLGHLVGIAGVSGSGKSSLINAISPIIKSSLKRRLGKNDREGLQTNINITNFVEVSQEPIGRSINSNPATFLNIWDMIRSIFAREDKAKQEGYSAASFSFNSKGACEQCKGTGRKSIEFGDGTKFYNQCRSCKGKRYKEEVLSITYKGKNIYDILSLQISEAIDLFSDQTKIVEKLKTVNDIGMGYITLGQPTSTLSGGEAQRLKLARELNKAKKKSTLYILDEPTTGLSYYDVSQLVKLLDRLVLQGNSVVLVEHHNEVLKQCDWIIELGPEGGSRGGSIICEDTPTNLTKNSRSLVGRYLNI